MAFKTTFNQAVFASGLFFMMMVVHAAGISYQIEVNGLACPFCAYGIEKELSAISGVEKVETNIKKGVVIVTMRDDEDLDESTAKQAVGDAGFTLSTFKRMSDGE